MQASIYLPSSLPFLSTKTSSTNFTSKTLLLFPVKHDHHQQCIYNIKTSSTSIYMIKATASDATEVDYDSMQSSVFPAEACETLGGVACDVEMFPETKLKQQPKSNNKVVNTQTVDREYLQYDNPKTVFIEEACDDLGGEFCEPAYQSGDN